MKPDDFKFWVAQRSSHAWWFEAALDAISKGHVALITGRSNPDDLYLARMWLTPPDDSSGRLDSADSVLLHCILKPDDDPHLHSHPWSFKTTVLSGWYDEETGGMHRLEQGDSSLFGRADFHRIADCQPFTWTLVQTGRRVSDWYFLVDDKCVPWNEYLGVEIAQ